MPAKTPEQICQLFREYMGKGDLDGVLTMYDPEISFLNRLGEIVHGTEKLRNELAPLAAAKADFQYDVKQVIESGDIALMHTLWKVSWPEPMSVYAIEVARRRRDGGWRWLIGDPFTVGKYARL